MCSTAQAQDIMILLIGETGAGKSSFVNSANGTPSAQVGLGLDACTSSVQAHSVRHSKGKLLLVDTPGFNQTNRSNNSIVEEIAAFLDRLDSPVRFGAVLLFVPLNEPRQEGMKGIQRASPKIWSELEPMNRVAVVAVEGKDVSASAAEKREAALRHIFNTGKWDNRTLIGERFDFAKGSALSILDKILEKGTAELCVMKHALAHPHPETNLPKSGRLSALLKRVFG